ncbi:hypothetical protein [Leptospira mayottensis]|uniref:hypothetical protein n=1 Tax=Leptospira mayottensis TaxID=1137606 RepID=UPI0020B12342|nr:hypothetical protein [Leptospira mayottensis]
MGEIFHEVVRPERIVNTESFDEPWYPGDAVGTVVLMEDGKKTIRTLRAKENLRWCFYVLHGKRFGD